MTSAIQRFNGEWVCLATGHTITADRLIEDTRILLKNLRVLEVTRVVPTGDTLTVHYWEHAAKDRGSLEVLPHQPVKILCEGRCPVSRDLDRIL